MSTRLTHYVIWGIYLKRNEELFEKIFKNYEEYKEKYPSIEFLVDGMDGKYVVIGKVLVKANEEECFFDGPTSIKDLKISKKDKKQVQNIIDELDKEILFECEHWFISHYH